MLAIYLSVIFGIIAAQIAPGPNLLAVASVALSQGRKPAILVASGVATGVFLWVSAFALGVSVIFTQFPLTGSVLQLLGGGYFIWLSVRTLASAWRRNPSLIRPTEKILSSKSAYRRGLIVVLTNPKAAIMWAAVSAFLLGSGFSTTEVLSIAPIGSITAFIVYGGYGLLFSTTAANRIYQRSARSLELFFGLCFGAIGAKLVVDGLRSSQLD